MMSEITTRHGEGMFVSIIMPVHNEALFIDRSLTSILQQTYPKALMEIIVADGLSTDNTRETIERIAAFAEIPIYIVDNPRRIAPTGLNLALERASGDIIIRVDGHCEIEVDYVENCVALLLSGKADGVGGPIETIGKTLLSQAIALAMSSPFGVGGSAFRTINDREMYTDTVAFPGYSREIIETAGAFNEELVRNQDDEYNYRIRKLGGKILLSPTIRSRYFSRSTFKSLWRQYFQYGYWKVRVFQLHPRQMRLRQFVPLIFVASLIGLSLLSLFSPVGRWVSAAVIVSYLFANFGAAIYTAKAKVALTPTLSLSFFILHFSYGLGSLVGLIAFRNRWRTPSDLNIRQIDRA
jgi:succinoglycan biosynthesis protein ExoA